MSVTVLVGLALHISQQLLDWLLADYKHAEMKRNVVQPALFVVSPPAQLSNVNVPLCNPCLDSH